MSEGPAGFGPPQSVSTTSVTETTADCKSETQPTLNADQRPSVARETQSLVHTLGSCWRRPSLLATELAWRWLFGVPALLLFYWVAGRIFSTDTLAPTGIYDFSLADPGKVVVVLSEALRVVTPPMLSASIWLAPLLAIGWAVASGVGRNLVLRRYDPTLPFRPWTQIALQLLRVVALGGSFTAWFLAMRCAARVALGGIDVDGGGAARDPNPNLVLYLALVICISLGMFTVWALLSWVFSAAPLIALAERQSIIGSLIRSVRLGRLSGKLVEVNLVLGIVKLALIVLAMVVSAMPLPFEDAMSGTPLYLWWAAVTVIYLAASDFFQVARLVAFLDLLRADSLRV